MERNSKIFAIGIFVSFFFSIQSGGILTACRRPVIVPLDDNTALVIERIEHKQITIHRADPGSLRKKRIQRYAKVFVKNQKSKAKVPKLNLKNVR